MEAQKAQSKHDSGAADLEKVTDYAEEEEISNGSLNTAIDAINTKHQKEASDKAKREKELASVVIKKPDVDLISSELEIPKDKAERILREHNGDPVLALRTLLSV
jgi:NACalpha-BTF3-like transcription factor